MAETTTPSIESIHTLLLRLDGWAQTATDRLRGIEDRAQAANDRLRGIEDHVQAANDRLRGIEDWVQVVNDRLRHLEAMNVEMLRVQREHASRMDRLQLRLPPARRAGASITG